MPPTLQPTYVQERTFIEWLAHTSTSCSSSAIRQLAERLCSDPNCPRAGTADVYLAYLETCSDHDQFRQSLEDALTVWMWAA